MYRQLFEASPRPMWVFERSSRRVVAVNDAAVAMYGWSRDELLQMRLDDLRPVSERTKLAAFFAGGNNISGVRVARHWTKAGEIIEVQLELSSIAVGETQYGIAVTTRATSLTAAEQALRRSESNFRSLIERAPMAMLVQREGRFAYANRAAVSLFGFDNASEMIGLDVLTTIHPDDHTIIRECIQSTIDHGMTPPREVRMVRRDGSGFVAEAEASRLELDGQPANVVFARDVTERSELFTRMALAERMVAVGTLAAGVAHEINNPLAYISTNLEIIASELPRVLASKPTQLACDELPALVTDARDGVARVSAIVRDLRALARPEVDARGPVDVVGVLVSSIKMAHNEIRHRARVVAAYEPGLPAVLAHPSRLGQVFLNLLLNAAQAIPEGRAEDNEIRVRAMTRGEHVVVEIEDTGVGISPAIMGRIFDPFFTTKQPGVGMGLGLAISHQIVSTMDGRITVASIPGAGTTFTVTLPAARADHRAPSEPPVVLSPRSRILIVDDEPAVARSLSALLSRHHQATAVTHAHDALARLLAGERFDVILCDLMMPDVSGIELYDLLAPEDRARIVFMTGGAFTQQAREFLAQIECPHVNKPFTERELRAAIEQVRGADAG
jgi:PAS domain S-box-containing protein